MKIAKEIAKRGGLGEKENVLMDYALRNIWNDVSKMAVYTLLAFAIGMHKLFFAVCILYTVVRVFTGGIHMKTYWGCFWFTLLSLSIMMGAAIILKDYCRVLCWLTCISLVVIMIVGPRPSRNKKKMSRRKRYVFSCLALIIEVVILIFMSMGIKNPTYQMGIILSLLINNAVQKALDCIGLQLFWAAALWLLTKALFGLAIRKVSINGG